MLKRNIIQNIANKEMDRVEFLKYGGLVLLSVVGLGAIVNAISQVDLAKTISDDATRGFGGGKYGV